MLTLSASARLTVGVTLLFGGVTAPALAADGPPSLTELKQLNVEDLMNIEVTSVARRPEKLLVASAAIQVITQAEIRRSGATTLPQALRLADNLQTAQRGARGWAISARGFNTDLANKLLVMIDGRTVYTPLFSGVFWEAQDYLLEDIDRIEVISGPGGTLWGANAVNGVINIITRSAADTQGLHAEAGGGSEQKTVAGLRYGGSFSPDVHFRVFGKYLDRDDSVFADGSAAGDSWHRTQGGFRVDSKTMSGDPLTVQGDFYTDHERVPASGATRMQGANLLGRWTHSTSADSHMTLQSYFDWTSLSDMIPAAMIGSVPLSPAGRLRDDLKTFDLDFQQSFTPGGAHAVIWGLGYRHTHDVVANAPGLAFLPPVLDQDLFSTFLQDEIRLRDSLSLTIGTKIEHNDYTGFEIEPSARLQWQLLDSQTLWAAISRAVRTPSRIDREMSQPAPPYLTILKGDPDFRSEKVIAYELGYRAQLNSAVTTSLSTFYNVYDDVRSTSITPVTLLPFFFENNLAGHSYGLEFTGRLQLTEEWSLRTGYNLLKEKLHVKAGAFDLSNARNETSDPEHQISLRTALNLPRGVELDAGLRWVGTLQNSNGPNPGTVPDYLELDARVGWHVSDRLEISIVGQDLLHDHHPEYGFPDARRMEVQRSIYGKLTWQH